jgi:hypothetical protein
LLDQTGEAASRVKNSQAKHACVSKGRNCVEWRERVRPSNRSVEIPSAPEKQKPRKRRKKKKREQKPRRKTETNAEQHAFGEYRDFAQAYLPCFVHFLLSLLLFSRFPK